MTDLTLVSHYLCPYVQRVAIALEEKKVPFRRIYVDLANKPHWFKALSPLGKVPVLEIKRTARYVAIFESAVILEYLEETQPRRLHPADPLSRAEHRSWIEFGSSVLNGIAALYAAQDEAAFQSSAKSLAAKFAQMEGRLGGGPYFDGERFSLVDAVFAPVFRYFNVFDQIGDFGILGSNVKLAAWRNALSVRPSVKAAVTDDYEARLWRFLEVRMSHLSGIMPKTA